MNLDAVDGIMAVLAAINAFTMVVVVITNGVMWNTSGIMAAQIVRFTNLAFVLLFVLFMLQVAVVVAYRAFRNVTA